MPEVGEPEFHSSPTGSGTVGLDFPLSNLHHGKEMILF